MSSRCSRIPVVPVAIAMLLGTGTAAAQSMEALEVIADTGIDFGTLQLLAVLVEHFGPWGVVGFVAYHAIGPVNRVADMLSNAADAYRDGDGVNIRIEPIRRPPDGES